MISPAFHRAASWVAGSEGTHRHGREQRREAEVRNARRAPSGEAELVRHVRLRAEGPPLPPELRLQELLRGVALHAVHSHLAASAVNGAWRLRTQAVDRAPESYIDRASICVLYTV